MPITSKIRELIVEVAYTQNPTKDLRVGALDLILSLTNSLKELDLLTAEEKKKLIEEVEYRQNHLPTTIL